MESEQDNGTNIADKGEESNSTEITPTEGEDKLGDKKASLTSTNEDADKGEESNATEITPTEGGDTSGKEIFTEIPKHKGANTREEAKEYEYTSGKQIPTEIPRNQGQTEFKILLEKCQKCEDLSKENEGLRDKILEYEVTRKRLQEVGDKLTKENEKNQTNLEKIQREHLILDKEMAEKDMANQEQIACLQKDLSKQIKSYKDLKKKQEQTERDIQSKKRDIESLQKNISEQKKRNTDKLKRKDEEIKKKDEETKNTIKKLKNENDCLKNEQENHRKLIGEFKMKVKEQNDKIKSNEYEMHQGSLKFQKLSYQHDAIFKQKQTLQEENMVLNGEKQDLLLRLSKVAGANLTYNNPNIADLSDENRPTKLAEEFSELYDNEWTDAFEVLPFEEDEQKTKYMINILEEASRLCSDLSKGHDKRIKDSLRILTAKVYINRWKLSCEEKDENSTQSDVEAVTPIEPPEVVDGETNKDKGENTDVIKKENDEKGDLEAGESSNENEGNGVKKDNDKQRNFKAGKSSNGKERNAEKEREDEHSDKNSEADKIKKDNSVVSKKNTDEKSDFEEGTSLHENGGNVAKKDNDKQCDFEAGTSSNENKGNVAKESEVGHSDKVTESDTNNPDVSKIDNAVQSLSETETSFNEQSQPMSSNEMKIHGEDQETIKADTEVVHGDRDTKSDRNKDEITDESKESEVGHSDKDTESDTNNPDVSKIDNAVQSLSETETSFNEQSQPKSSNEMKIHGEDQETIKADTEVVHGDRDTKSDRNKDEITDESKEPEVEHSVKNTESERNKDGSSDVSKKETDGEVDTNQYDENTIEITISSDFDLLSKEQKKTIMEAKNVFEIELTNKVETTVTDLITKSIQMKMESRDLLETYIKKCVSICWLMCRHNPPVFIEFPDVKENIPFDTNKYKPYTRSGKFIDHIVWPALQLHEGGPLLCKGVAQGIGQKDCNKLCK